MVKQARNIHCTICGKTYVDPIAAQNHTRKHSKAQQSTSLVMVMPRHPGTTGAHPTANQTGITDAGVGSANSIPLVATPPTPRSKKVGKSKTGGSGVTCRWCPNLSGFRTPKEFRMHKKKVHMAIYECSMCSTSLNRYTMKKHLRELHGISGKKNIKKIKRTFRKTVKNTTIKKQPVGGGPSTGLLYHEPEGNISYEDDDSDSSSSDDEGQLPSEDEQPTFNQMQCFNCRMCPASFPTVEGLIMHTKFVHCLTCGYCAGLPTFHDALTWKQHLAMIHGIRV